MRPVRLICWLSLLRTTGILGSLIKQVHLTHRPASKTGKCFASVEGMYSMLKRPQAGLRLSGGQDKTDFKGDWTSMLNKEDRDFFRDVVVHKNVSGLGLTFSKEPPYQVPVGLYFATSGAILRVFFHDTSLT